ncbi:MAG: metal ABC transporter permease [Planctomycetota bacterium]|nr:MAG: metal ABC transporter permease [Planctomycetota bacterium]
MWRVLTLRGGFNTNTVLAGTTLLGLAAGVVGAFALLRKRSLMADALSHATLPGIGLAFLAATALGIGGRSLPVLLAGAAATGVLGVVCVQALLRHSRLREDAAIGAVLSVFFGAGVVVLSYIQKNAGGNAGGLSHFIYGQTAAMRVSDAALMGGIALVAMVAAALMLKEFALVCFNDAFARVDGWPVSRIDLMMMALVVLVTVAGLQAVGLLLVVAMLIIPPVAARFWTERLLVLVVLSGVIGAASGYLGASISALLPRKPAGAVIVLAAGCMFAISLLFAPRRGVIASSVARWRSRLRMGGEHVLEAAFEAMLGGREAPTLSWQELDRLARVRGYGPLFRLMVRQWLGWRGLARFDASGVTLTDRGAERGRTVWRNHALWGQYLVGYADIAPSHVDWSVDRVEHVLDAEMIARLEERLRARGIEVVEEKRIAAEGRY